MQPVPEGASHTVGSVLALLREDYPDLTISKVRFLDAEGLVSPGRSASGYRRYSDSDIERLRFVLTAQRDRFWPLRVIREALDAYDRGLQPAMGEDPRPVPPPVSGDSDLLQTQTPADPAKPDPPLRLTLAEVARGAGLTEVQVRDLAGFGLITAHEGYFGRPALVIARSAAALMARGLGARHLRTFRLAAEREAAIVTQLRGGSAESQVVGECLELHLALLRAQVALAP